MSQHTITAEIKVRFWFSGMAEDERETAYPKVEITYGFTRGAREVRPDLQQPGSPADPDEIELISAKLIDGDGVGGTQEQVNDWARAWLDDEGYEEACCHAAVDNQPDPDDARDRMLEDREMQYDDGRDDF